MTMTMHLLWRSIQDGARQGILTVGVQIGVGLVEHKQKWVAEYRPRQPNSLPLARRQRHAALRQFASHSLPAGAG